MINGIAGQEGTLETAVSDAGSVIGSVGIGSIGLDTTLTMEGYAADAKATGAAIDLAKYPLRQFATDGFTADDVGTFDVLSDVWGVYFRASMAVSYGTAVSFYLEQIVRDFSKFFVTGLPETYSAHNSYKYFTSFLNIVKSRSSRNEELFCISSNGDSVSVLYIYYKENGTFKGDVLVDNGTGRSIYTADDENQCLVLKTNGHKTYEYPKGLPAVTTADNGKILKVVDGQWAVVDAE